MSLVARAVEVMFGINVDKDSINKANKAIAGIKQFATKALGTIGIGLSFSGIKGMVAVADAAQQTARRLQRIFTDADTGKSYAAQATANLQKVSKETDIAAGRMKPSFMDIAVFAKTAGMSAAESSDFAAEAMRACADASAFLNKDFANTVYLMKALMRGNTMMAKRMGLNITAEQQETLSVQMYNASFKELTETQKKWVMLKLYENAIKEAGGLGAAAEKANTWANQMENLDANIKLLKINIGTAFLKPFIWGAKMANWAISTLAKAVGTVTAKNGFWSKTMETLNRLYNRFSQAIAQVTNRLRPLGKVGENAWKWFINLLGGEDNATQLLSLVLGVVGGLLTLKGTISMVSVAFKGLATAFSFIGASGLIVVMAVTAILLIIQDLIYFIDGEEPSAIGKIFEYLGINADEARQKIIDFVNSVIAWFRNLIYHIQDVWNNASNIPEAIGKLLGEALATIVKWILEFAVFIIKNIPEILHYLLLAVGFIFVAILTIVIEVLTAILSTIWNFCSGLVDAFAEAWENAKEATFEGLKSLAQWISNKLDDIEDTITSWAKGAWEWGADMIDNFIDGIKNSLPSLDGVVDSIGNTIKSKMHFSLPDKGPLADADKWMPDMINLMVQGINANKDKLGEAVTAMAGDMNQMMQAATASSATAAVSNISNRSMSITQNVDISNSYTGGSAETQRNVSRAMNQSANDATAAMARGLAYSV